MTILLRHGGKVIEESILDYDERKFSRNIPHPSLITKISAPKMIKRTNLGEYNFGKYRKMRIKDMEVKPIENKCPKKRCTRETEK